MMWTWTLNWDEIRADILIGSCPTEPADLDRIAEQAGAGALLSLQTDECRAALGIDYHELQEHGRARDLKLVNAPMRDFDAEDQRERLPDAAVALHRLLAAGRRVYVHCTAGINRAPLTVLGYLALIERMDEGAAWELISRGRSRADPYWEAYAGCRGDLIDRHSDAIDQRAAELSRDRPNDPALVARGAAEAQVIREALLGEL